MNESETLDLIGRLLRGEGDDSEIGEWLDSLEKGIPCPHIQDLIKNSDHSDTAETILSKARQYNPIRL
jgi:hypothetical protein